MDINILTEQEAATLKEWIATSSHIVLVGHKSPDGDAVGASLGWAEYLRYLGKNPTVVMPDAYPDFLHWLPNNEKIMRYDKHPEEVKSLFSVADLVFYLDFSEETRVDDMTPILQNCKARKVIIDHHPGGGLEGALVLSRLDASSTCELIFRIVWQLGGFEFMTQHYAAPVYCGMMTDTGGFTYNSNDPAIYFIISQLLTKHINKDKIYRNVFNNYSSWAIRLRGYIMYQKLNVFEDLHASYYTITRKELKSFHYIKGDAEGLVNEPLRIKNMKLSISMREDTDQENLIWLSLRSVDDFPCDKMSQDFFNGGGHPNASGGKLFCSIDEAEKVVRKAIKAYSSLLQ